MTKPQTKEPKPETQEKTEEKAEAKAEAEAVAAPEVVADPAEALLAKLRKVNARGLPQRLQRSAITPAFLDRVPTLSFVWVYDRQGASDVPQYKAMGYEVFDIPSGTSPEEVCPAASQDGSRLRLDDCILMYTLKERVQDIMNAIQNNLRMTKIEQSDLIETGHGDDKRPAGKESELEMRPRDPMTPDEVAAILEARSKKK